ncbi:MAG: hypothetical protein ACREJC_07440 [Tepidisphaeraceae bacterium]
MSNEPASTDQHPGDDAPRSAAPTRGLADLPRDELEHLAEEFGLDPTQFKSRQLLVATLSDRRQAIAAMDREAMLDVVRWGRRPVSNNASQEQLAIEIAKIRSMRFGGLSHRGLLALARLRGVRLRGAEDEAALMRRLKKQEGFLARLNRRRRAMIGSLVSGMIGGDEAEADYQFLPPQQADAAPAPPTPSRPGTIKEEIEESGLFGGLASRVKKTADSYLNQKLDEIESRIDRKLDEIDRRLAEWRDKEIANRIRILKITLWASVIVAILSLIYSYFKVYFQD